MWIMQLAQQCDVDHPIAASASAVSPDATVLVKGLPCLPRLRLHQGTSPCWDMK